jgi:hypothetical protein
MNLVSAFQTNPAGITGTSEETLFIWLDVLGFADAVDDESKYRELSSLLKKFQILFNTSHKYETQIISDGIVLYVKDTKAKNIRSVFQDIAQKQLEFIIENSYFIRGGIALGSRFEDAGENALFISNGLARAVKLESSVVDWPVIGIDDKNIQHLRRINKIDDDRELFGLKQGYNKNGQTIYFIDFVQKDPVYVDLLYAKILEFEDPKYQVIRNKYIWLLRYFLHKYDDQQIGDTLQGIVL